MDSGILRTIFGSWKTAKRAVAYELTVHARINFVKPESSPTKLYKGLEMLLGENIAKVWLKRFG